MVSSAWKHAGAKSRQEVANLVEEVIKIQNTWNEGEIISNNKALSGVYIIRNIINDKVYIGVSIDIHRRWKEHVRDLKNKRHRNKHLERAWHYYGKDNFEFRILEECDRSLFAEREIFWISHYHANDSRYGYNQTSGGDGTSEVVFSPERNHKISLALKGRILPQFIGENNPRARCIVCLNSGEKYNTIEEVAKLYNCHNSNIIQSCKTHSCITDEYLVFSYEEDYQSMSKCQIEEIVQNAILKRKHNLGHGRTVVCVNTKEVFQACSLAAQKYNIDNSNIHKCCRGDAIYCGYDAEYGPLVWRYLEDYNSLDEYEIARILSKANEHQNPYGRKRPVVCLETGNIYSSIKQAAKEYNINYMSLFNKIKRDNQYIIYDNNNKYTLKFVS